MTTNDLFASVVTAMAHFGDVPFAGEVVSFGVHQPGYIHISLDSAEQPAAALLAWFYSLDRRDLHTRQMDGKTFVSVDGKRNGVDWHLYSTFTGEDTELLHGGEQVSPPVLVHRLREVQMRQTAALVGAA